MAIKIITIHMEHKLYSKMQKDDDQNEKSERKLGVL